MHLVLARTPNAPEGIKGISLFLVPKILPNKDGTLDKKNNVKCGSIEKKMGIKASPTCVMHYEEAQGWLVGDLNKGMKAMFIMMNGARLMVGVQGLGIAEIAYQSALHYSKERLQGRSLKESKHPDYTGYVVWEGERINVAGWKSKSKDGKQTYLSLRCSEPQVKDDSGDDLPF